MIMRRLFAPATFILVIASCVLQSNGSKLINENTSTADDHKVKLRYSRHLRSLVSEDSTYTISTSNTIIIDTKEYNLEFLEEVPLLAENFTMTLDGEGVSPPISGTSYWAGEDNDAEIFMTKDEYGYVDFLSIIDESGALSFINSEENPGELRLQMLDPAEDQVSLEGDYIITPYSDLSYLNDTDSPLDNNNDTALEPSACGYYKKMDIAIATDYSYCSWLGGSTKALRRVKQVVGIASSKFRKQGLCINLRLSAFEGICNYSKDIYRNMRTHSSGCVQKGWLQDFTHYWHNNRKSIPRDAAHLFTAKKFQDGMTGCAGIATLCKYAYGLASMSFTGNIQLQGILFAHELAHNCGANHFNHPSGIMHTSITQKAVAFSSTSLSSMSKYLKNAYCVS